jgi:hypothetical protein
MSVEQGPEMQPEVNVDQKYSMQVYFPLIELPDVYTSWNDDKSAASCDRRLSRAAREFLRRHLLHTVFRDLERVERDLKSFASNENWDESAHTLLERWVASIPNVGNANGTKEKCPLYQDLYRDDDALTKHVYVQSLPGGVAKNLKIAYPQSVLKYSHTSDETKNPNFHLYQCGYCGKTFITQFYLDVHLTTHHFHNESAPDMVCPATEWCKLVGMANCHHQAVQAEPFYDRGSSSLRDVSTALIQHKWSKVAHSVPCSVQQLRKDCESILASCGLLSPHEDKDYDRDPTTQQNEMTAVLFCQALTCPPQQNLWNYFEEEAHGYLLGLTSTTSIISAASFRSQWETIWRAETEHHDSLFSWMGITVVGFLVTWILKNAVVAAKMSIYPARSIPSGQRLLHKKRSQYQSIASRNSVAKRRNRIKID